MKPPTPRSTTPQKARKNGQFYQMISYKNKMVICPRCRENTYHSYPLGWCTLCKRWAEEVSHENRPRVPAHVATAYRLIAAGKTNVSIRETYKLLEEMGYDDH